MHSKLRVEPFSPPSPLSRSLNFHRVLLFFPPSRLRCFLPPLLGPFFSSVILGCPFLFSVDLLKTPSFRRKCSCPPEWSRPLPRSPFNLPAPKRRAFQTRIFLSFPPPGFRYRTPFLRIPLPSLRRSECTGRLPEPSQQERCLRGTRGKTISPGPGFFLCKKRLENPNPITRHLLKVSGRGQPFPPETRV